MHILFWLSQFARPVKPQKSHIGNESFVTNFSPVQVEILKDHRLNPRGDMHFYEDLPCYLLLSLWPQVINFIRHNWELLRHLRWSKKLVTPATDCSLIVYRLWTVIPFTFSIAINITDCSIFCGTLESSLATTIAVTYMIVLLIYMINIFLFVWLVWLFCFIIP